MRSLAGLLILVACAPSTPAPEPVEPTEEQREGRIVARVTGFRNGNGQVLARLYRGKDGFPGKADKAFHAATFTIIDGKATVVFDDVPYGEYAVWVCHDEDGDGKLATNLIGMPKEGADVSGPPPSFIPSYDDARFRLESPEHAIEIALRYL
ncbi:MAG: DUF2141 domain-containing protein [Planctomycetota bacterium]